MRWQILEKAFYRMELVNAANDEGKSSSGDIDMLEFSSAKIAVVFMSEEIAIDLFSYQALSSYRRVCQY